MKSRNAEKQHQASLWKVFLVGCCGCPFIMQLLEMPTGETGSARDSCVCSVSVCQASMTTVRSGVYKWHSCTYPQRSFCGADGLQAFLCSYSLQPYHCSLQMFSFQQLSEWIVANLWAIAIHQRDSSISKKDASHTRSVQAQVTIVTEPRCTSCYKGGRRHSCHPLGLKNWHFCSLGAQDQWEDFSKYLEHKHHGSMDQVISYWKEFTQAFMSASHIIVQNKTQIKFLIRTLFCLYWVHWRLQ